MYAILPYVSVEYGGPGNVPARKMVDGRTGCLVQNTSLSLEGLCQPRGLRHHTRALTQYQAQVVLHKRDLQTSKRA